MTIMHFNWETSTGTNHSVNIDPEPPTLCFYAEESDYILPSLYRRREVTLSELRFLNALWENVQILHMSAGLDRGSQIFDFNAKQKL